MTRTNIDIDDDAVAEVMARYRLRTKREAVNFALHQMRHRPLTRAEIDELHGMGWGDDGLELSDLRGESGPIDEP